MEAVVDIRMKEMATKSFPLDESRSVSNVVGFAIGGKVDVMIDCCREKKQEILRSSYQL